MKKTFLLMFCLFSGLVLRCQTATCWQQETHYNIRVSLNDSSHSLTGDMNIHYVNHSPDTLTFIWFHLWPNAYKNDQTAFSDQLLENGRTDFYFAKESERGYINRLAFTVNDKPASMEDHPQHQDIIRVILPEPLLPGKDIRISTPFHVQLPANFSRGGHIGQSYQVTQWYPKPAVYDCKGWHEMPYLDQGEFYADFGQFDVQISLPENYMLAATGIMKDSSVQNGHKTVRFVQDQIHDFAWFADRNFIRMQDTMQLPSGKVDLYVYCTKNNAEKWKNGISYLRRAIRSQSQWLGDYPYAAMTVVERPGKKNKGGMEYPMITLISHPGDEKDLDEVIRHETGHNWFYGILASEERQHPWMDEGMNSYYDNRYIREFYTDADAKSKERSNSFMNKRIPAELDDLLLEGLISVKKDQPMETSSENFSMAAYGLVAYQKTAAWMAKMEKELGRPLFDSMMQSYYKTWKFKHPYPADFKKHAEQFTGKDLQKHFSQLTETGTLHGKKRKTLRVTSFFNLRNTDQHHDIFIAPLAGYNFYDKFMAGALIHNYTLPVTRLRFFLAPLYATGSSTLNGMGRISYDLMRKYNGSALTVSLSGARFTADQFIDSTGRKNQQPFSKLVPGIRYQFGNKNPRSSFSAFIQWKTFLISETDLAFRRDTVLQTDIITYPTRNRYLNQLRLVIQNSRVLYPYRAMLDAEQGKGFVRLAFTGQYFFNYAGGGGLNARLFAGKFMYTGTKTILTQFETERYHLNMTGPKGNEDYTYANYFVGRNEYEGLGNQQIMIRDGGFKVRTDLLSSKIGKTDNWLAALNLNTTIPKEINPLELLPVRIPVKLFADIGTYAEAWDKNASTGRFLYDAGFQLSLFKNVLNVYIPVIYSKVYADYFKSTITEKRFIRNISFSIDIQEISAKKIYPQNLF